MSNPNAPGPDTAKLADVRHQLLTLHKTLLDTERLWYEKEHGRVEGGNQMLQLLVNHPDFAWLRVISTLIVTIDEQMESKDNPLTDVGVDKLLAEVSALFNGNEGGEEFQRKLKRAQQERPEVVIAQSKLLQRLDR